MTRSMSYVERHASAAETFAVFAPDVAPERIAESFARRQGALGSLAFDVVGAMWSRPQLSRRDRSLLVISVLAAQARDEELVAHTRNGLRNGLTQDEIEEILLHVAAYAGFPAAMASSRRIDEALRQALAVEALPPRAPAAAKSDAKRDRDAADVLRTISPREIAPDQGLARMEEMLGEVGVTAYRFAFGDIWSRPQLSRRDRSIVVIAILVWLGAAPELDVHVPAGIRHGLTRTEIEEVINHLSLYAGIPRAVEATRAMKAAFARLDEAAAPSANGKISSDS
jgi:4-carboxymuconolactone decarboxylase